MPYIRPTYPVQTATIHAETALQSTASSWATKVLWSTGETPWSHTVHMTLCVHLRYTASHLRDSAFFSSCALGSLLPTDSGLLQHRFFHRAPDSPSMDGQSSLRGWVFSAWSACVWVKANTTPTLSLVHHLTAVLRVSPNTLMSGKAVHNHFHQHLILSIFLPCGAHKAILGYFTCH